MIPQVAGGWLGLPPAGDQLGSSAKACGHTCQYSAIIWCKYVFKKGNRKEIDGQTELSITLVW